MLAMDKALPESLPGFEGIQRSWEPTLQIPVARILPGEFYVTPHDEVISTVLGSCVSACIRDTTLKVGGMNHFLLPLPDRRTEAAGLYDDAATRYGSFAMERLMNEIFKAGGRRERLEVKVVGGGRMYASSNDVGRQNLMFLAEYLRQEGLKVVGKDIGQNFPRNVRYFPQTGKVLVRKLRPVACQEISEQELRYRERLEQWGVAGDVDLF